MRFRPLAFIVAPVLALGLFGLPVSISSTESDLAAQGLEAKWSQEELARILSFGPWPAPALLAEVRSRSEKEQSNNPLSEVPEAVALGELLFFEKRLSGNAQLSCASCHKPELGYTDGIATSVGIKQIHRNAQPLFNLSRQRWFGWDGGADSLWAATIRPLLDPKEMGGSAQGLAKLLQEDASLRELAKAIKNKPAVRSYLSQRQSAPPSLESITELEMVIAAMAIASWLETLETERTAFDRYRDALQKSNQAELRRSGFTKSAERGLKIFVGKGNCWICHGGPLLTNGEFHDTGIGFLVPSSKGSTAPEVDPGRYRGIERLRNDRYGMLGLFSPNPNGLQAELSASLLLQHRNWGEWKIPSLRNLKATAPYMHNGSIKTLREVVQHYSQLNEERLHADGEALLKPLKLAPQEVDDLLAFLESLS